MCLSLEALTSIKYWRTYSGGTDRPGERCCNFSISNDVSQMVNFSTRISDIDSQRPALISLFISSQASICSTVTYPPLGNFNHVVVSVSIDFLSNLQRHAPFSSHSLCWLWRSSWSFKRYRRISLNSVLLQLLVNFVSGFRLELVYITLIVSIRSSLTHLHGFQLLVLLP